MIEWVSKDSALKGILNMLIITLYSTTLNKKLKIFSFGYLSYQIRENKSIDDKKVIFYSRSNFANKN